MRKQKEVPAPREGPLLTWEPMELNIPETSRVIVYDYAQELMLRALPAEAGPFISTNIQEETKLNRPQLFSAMQRSLVKPAPFYHDGITLGSLRLRVSRPKGIAG